MHSLTHRLVVVVLLSELLLTGAVTAINLVYERSQRYKAFDVMVRGRADSVLGAVEAVGDSDALILNKKTIEIPALDLYEVHLDTGQQLGASSQWSQLQHGTIDFQTSERFDVGELHYRSVYIHGSRTIDPDNSRPRYQAGVSVFYASPTNPVREALVHATIFLVATNFAILLLSGLMAAMLIRRGMKPLQQLAVEAGAVSATSWTFNAPSQARSLQELSGLVLAIERTLQGLERSFIQQQTFINDAAHELKTAITIIKSSLQLLNYKERTTQEYYLGVETSLADCGRMEELVQTMLTLARVEQQANNGHSASREMVDSASSLRDAIAQLDSVAELKSTAIKTDLSPNQATQVTSEDWNILCSNLVMNAIQHSSPRSEVRVVTAVNDGYINLIVHDSGQGIPAASIPFVFDRFYRGDPSRTRKTGGTGLGLAICKAVAESYHGKIAIQSEKDKGTTVIVRLPIQGSTN